MNSYEELIEFAKDFDREVSELVAEKRKQLELENNTVEYVKLDRIKENMLALQMQVYPLVDTSTKDNGYLDILRENVDSMMVFLNAVTGLEWMKSRYMEISSIFTFSFSDVTDDDDDKITNISAIKCFFKAVYMRLIAEKKLKADEWMPPWKKSLLEALHSK